MYKEFIIILTVIALIVGLDITTNHYTQNSVAILSEELNDLREDILQENKEIAQKKMEKIKEKWKERYNVLAYYIEHDELEKVETELVLLKGNIEVKQYEQGIPNLSNCIFILEHIKEKMALQIKNIF